MLSDLSDHMYLVESDAFGQIGSKYLVYISSIYCSAPRPNRSSQEIDTLSTLPTGGLNAIPPRHTALYYTRKEDAHIIHTQ